MTTAEAERVRREFIARENRKLDAFIGDPSDLAGWFRQYRCGCGYRTTAPQNIWEHAAVCKDKDRSNP